MSGMNVGSPSHELISVVIPAYNAQRTLMDTLDSVFMQTWPAVEVIVVDDGSTDGTWQLLQSLGSRIRCLHQDNAGLAAARRTGLAAARGRWVALLDADDLCHPERLAVQAAVMRRFPDVVLCGTDFSSFDEQGHTITSYAPQYYARIGRAPKGVESLLEHTDLMVVDGCGPAEGIRVSHGNGYRHLAHGNFMHPPTLMFRRDLLEQIGSFDPDARSMCDWDWIARAARIGAVAYVDHPLIRYRLSAGQMSSSRHRARAALDTLLVAERICRRDEALYLADLSEFLHDMGYFCLDAADALAESDRRLAGLLLGRSVTHFRRLEGRTARVLGKILTPGWVLRAMRERRGIVQAAA